MAYQAHPRLRELASSNRAGRTRRRAGGRRPALPVTSLSRALPAALGPAARPHRGALRAAAVDRETPQGVPRFVPGGRPTHRGPTARIAQSGAECPSRERTSGGRCAADTAAAPHPGERDGGKRLHAHQLYTPSTAPAAASRDRPRRWGRRRGVDRESRRGGLSKPGRTWRRRNQTRRWGRPNWEDHGRRELRRLAATSFTVVAYLEIAPRPPGRPSAGQHSANVVSTHVARRTSSRAIVASLASRFCTSMSAGGLLLALGFTSRSPRLRPPRRLTLSGCPPPGADRAWRGASQRRSRSSPRTSAARCVSPLAH